MNSSPIERRSFVCQSSVLAAAAATFPAGASAQTAGGDKLGVGLIGCGGRGTGATAQALAADDRSELRAMADIDAEALERSRVTLEKNAPRAEQVRVDPEARYVGLDAFRKLLGRDDIDVVVLTTPPGFRPFHFEAAVEAGKHVFMEKPVAVDGPGVRKVLASAKRARAEGLKVGVGLNRRHSPLHHEVIGRIHDGAIGELPLVQIFNCRADVNKRSARRPGESELSFQVRNWYYFTWLSGDFLVEQSVHEYDVVRWIKHDQVPVSCQGQGGRIVRTGPENGQIYDHFSVDYQFEDGSLVTTQHRHVPGCWNWFGEKIHGTKGSAELSFKRSGFVRSNRTAGTSWRGNETGNSYQREHDALFSAIRNGEDHNEGERGALSTLFAIMGRTAAYTGQVVTWEEVMQSEEAIAIDPRDWDEEPPLHPNAAGEYPVPAPGRKPG